MRYHLSMRILNNLKIHTPEISKLKELVETAQEWISEAESTIDAETDLSKLTRLLGNARKLNVNLDLFDSIKTRQAKATALISKIEISGMSSDGKKTRSKIKRSVRKEKFPKKDVMNILKQLEDLKIKSEKQTAINEHIKEINEWEKKAKEMIESNNDDLSFEDLDNLVNQSKEFKYSVELVHELQNKLDFIEWKSKAQAILTKVESNSHQDDANSQESPNKGRAKGSKKTNILEDVNCLLKDAQRKNFKECKEYEQLEDLIK